jgi:DNA-directed RNA polymerase specialized sigma24 family protein
MSSSKPDLDAIAQALGPRLGRYLSYHHFSLRDQHDDLVQTTLADTLKYLDAAPVSTVDEDEVARIAFTILKRRVADAFRDNARQWALQQSAEPDEESAHDTAASVDFRRVLQAVIELMATLDPAERDLISQAALGTQLGRPRSDAERKALSRARASLKSKLWSRHRIDLDRFLEEPSS